MDLIETGWESLGFSGSIKFRDLFTIRGIVRFSRRSVLRVLS
jgi:hypothetical protein